jgi:tRNA-specific 2-thiouridylase
VLAAMSGGVDSAVAAARAVDAGHDVTGVHLALAEAPASLRTGARGCCTVEDARDARRAADVLGIPFYVWDLAQRFRADVVDDFVAEYAAGRTPNPCLRCNEKIKFAAVLDRALALGFDAVVTGHHARLDADGVLRRSVDAGKDQSYVLAVLTREQLAHAVFPLGESTKAAVRAEAARRGLAVADKPDSHDVCFIADGDTRGFLAQRLGARPGPLVDAVTGEQLGSHDGAYAFTVGQRRGLRIDRPAPDGRPRYVLDITPATGTVTVGPGELLDVAEVVGVRPVWTAGRPPAVTFECTAQLRAHGGVSPATARLDGDRVTVALHRPQRGIAPGQAAVFYAGDAVLGSATISATGAPGATAAAGATTAGANVAGGATTAGATISGATIAGANAAGGAATAGGAGGGGRSGPGG